MLSSSVVVIGILPSQLNIEGLFQIKIIQINE
jgi:hypothetical protein